MRCRICDFRVIGYDCQTTKVRRDEVTDGLRIPFVSAYVVKDIEGYHTVDDAANCADDLIEESEERLPHGRAHRNYY